MHRRNTSSAHTKTNKLPANLTLLQPMMRLLSVILLPIHDMMTKLSLTLPLSPIDINTVRRGRGARWGQTTTTSTSTVHPHTHTHIHTHSLFHTHTYYT